MSIRDMKLWVWRNRRLRKKVLVYGNDRLCRAKKRTPKYIICYLENFSDGNIKNIPTRIKPASRINIGTRIWLRLYPHEQIQMLRVLRAQCGETRTLRHLIGEGQGSTASFGSNR